MTVHYYTVCDGERPTNGQKAICGHAFNLSPDRLFPAGPRAPKCKSCKRIARTHSAPYGNVKRWMAAYRAAIEAGGKE